MIATTSPSKLFKHLFWKSNDFEVPLKIFKKIIEVGRRGLKGKEWNSWGGNEGISRLTIYFYLRELRNLGMIKRACMHWFPLVSRSLNPYTSNHATLTPTKKLTL